jgi:hypothetical protein
MRRHAIETFSDVLFTDRVHAGRVLADALGDERTEDGVVSAAGTA